MLPLSPAQKALHQRAIALSRNHRRIEWLLTDCLEEVERTKLYKRLGLTSLFEYAVKVFAMSEPVAYSFIAVARKAAIVPTLKKVLKDQRISVSTANRMVSALTQENAEGLIAFATTHTTRELDFEVAKQNPKAKKKTRIKVIAADLVELRVNLARSTYDKLRRCQDLASPSEAKDLVATLDLLADDFLKRKDPVARAERAAARNEKKREKPDKPETELCTNRVPTKRKPLTAQEKHAVVLRCDGQCTFQDSRGVRCTNRRWLHIHHIHPVSLGGANDPENLTVLCSAHHDLVHQLGFPIEGQVSWVRERRIGYEDHH